MLSRVWSTKAESFIFLAPMGDPTPAAAPILRKQTLRTMASLPLSTCVRSLSALGAPSLTGPKPLRFSTTCSKPSFVLTSSANPAQSYTPFRSAIPLSSVSVGSMTTNRRTFPQRGSELWGRAPCRTTACSCSSRRPRRFALARVTAEAHLRATARGTRLSFGEGPQQQHQQLKPKQAAVRIPRQKTPKRITSPESHATTSCSRSCAPMHLSPPVAWNAKTDGARPHLS